MRYPNQRRVTVHRTLVKKEEKGRAWGIVYWDIINDASKNISGEVPFKLYLYFIQKSDNFTFDFSSQHFANTFGVSLDAARRAFKKLEEQGYLREEDRGVYSFYESPQMEGQLPTYTENKYKEKRSIMYKTFFADMTYLELYQRLKGEIPEKDIEELWENSSIAEDN